MWLPTIQWKLRSRNCSSNSTRTIHLSRRMGRQECRCNRLHQMLVEERSPKKVDCKAGFDAPVVKQCFYAYANVKNISTRNMWRQVVMWTTMYNTQSKCEEFLSTMNVVFYLILSVYFCYFIRQCYYSTILWKLLYDYPFNYSHSATSFHQEHYRFNICQYE